MIGDILQPTHLLFVLVVALLVLGPKRLPEMARTLGRGLRDFRAAINGEHNDGDDAKPDRQIAADDDEPPFDESDGHTALAHDESPAEPLADSESPAEPESTQADPNTASQSETDHSAHEREPEPERQS